MNTAYKTTIFFPHMVPAASRKRSLRHSHGEVPIYENCACNDVRRIFKLLKYLQKNINFVV